MRFRLGLVTGLAAGYYLGARAGRRRYDQINKMVARVRRSEAFEEVTDRAKAVVEEGFEKARDAVDQRTGHHRADAHQASDHQASSSVNGNGVVTSAGAGGIILPGPGPLPGSDPFTEPGGYSSSR